MSFQTRRIGEGTPHRRFPWRNIAALTVAAVSPLAGLVRAWRAKREEQAKQERRVFFLKRAFILLLAVLLSLLVLAGVAKALISLDVLNIRTILGMAAADMPVDERGFTNFLLLGKGDDDHDGVDLTDTIMVVSVDPGTKSAVMLSIPRDLYVTSGKMGNGRINQLYRDYKTELRRTEGLTREEASQAALRELLADIGGKLDIRLHYAAMVNFSGFVQAVDALGGVDVDVPEDIVDREYPGPNWTYETFEIGAGLAHLDGETALKYARSRHSTSDFGRSARQQQIIQALAEKAKTLGIIRSPRKIVSLLQILSENVETTMTGKELLGAARLGEQLDRSRVISAQLNDHSGLFGGLAEAGGFLGTPPREDYGGAAVLIPLPDGTGDGWLPIRTYLRMLMEMRPLYLSHPRLAVLNAGGKRGLAAALANELVRYGFDVERVENASDGGSLPPGSEQAGRLKQDASLVAPRTEEDRSAASFFAAFLGLPLGEAPTALPPEQQEQVTILLGNTFAFTPFTTLLQAPSSSSTSP